MPTIPPFMPQTVAAIDAVKRALALVRASGAGEVGSKGCARSGDGHPIVASANPDLHRELLALAAAP